MNNRTLSRLRRGQSLLLVFLMIVAIVGILALTLDFGFVILARRQMQTGVSTASMEGLRNVDIDNDGFGDGRESARILLRNVYDDDLDPSANNSTVGAGISSSLVQGDGFQQSTLGDGSGATNLFVNRSQYIYRPDPQLNNGNADHGDLVIGQFDDAALSHEELADYSRSDFQPGLNGSEYLDSFLVRLRRTHDPNGLDNISGVSSSGGGLPLLIGRLAWFSSTNAGSDYSIRRDGVTVRATSIADAKFAVRVWPLVSDEAYGAIQFGITKSNFVSQPNLIPHIAPTTVTLTHFGQVGSFSATGSYANETGYVAIIDEAISPSRVIGFFLSPPTSAPTRQPNSSCRVSDAWEVLGELTPAQRTELTTSRLDAATNSPHQILRSPAIVRSIR